MLFASIQLAEKYNYLEAKFKVGYDFLQNEDLAGLPVGAVALGDGVVANVQEYTTVSQGETPYETHDRHFDIQYVVSGHELFGVAPRENLEVTEAYDAEKDATFYADPPIDSKLYLQPGDLAVVAPEDGHKPRLMAGMPCKVKKIVIKIPV